MIRVCMIGSGYVGLVSGACFAALGHKVICVDKDKSKIDVLNKGGVPIYEPGLEELIAKSKKAGRISFSTDVPASVKASDVIFIAVNTPSAADGSADLSFVEACTREVAKHANGYKLLVEKSTVPVETGERIMKTLKTMNIGPEKIEVASNPEFLREGSALEDFLKPDRIVIGVQSKKAEKLLRELYKKIKGPILAVDIKSAELIKHASNSFLALKISYINAIAQICEKVGADVIKVAEGMGLDARIGRSFLNAGIGYGGSCFPKDVAAFIKIASKQGIDFDLLKGTERINNEQRGMIVKKLEETLWTLKNKTIAVWGLAFKPNTDDLRNAPAKDIIESLLAQGATVRGTDPVAMDKMKALFPNIAYCKDAMEAAKGADAVLVVTDWADFKKVNLKKLKATLSSPIVIDGRNIFDPQTMADEGFIYHCVGRPPVAHP